MPDLTSLLPKKKRRPEKHANHERWIISYSDLMTLLLAVFIALWASSHKDQHKMDVELMGFIKAFHGTPVPIVSAPSADRGVMKQQPSNIPKPIPSPASADSKVPKAMIHQISQEMVTLQNIQKQLSKVLQPLVEKNEVKIQSQPLTLTIELNASVLFQSGDASLMPQAISLLNDVAASLTHLPDRFSVVVQGYTDDQPIASAQFSSNWSLSAERAVSVVELFQTAGVPGQQLAAQGFGPFQPVAPNTDNAGRALNRRVSIVIHAPDPTGK